MNVMRNHPSRLAFVLAAALVASPSFGQAAGSAAWGAKAAAADPGASVESMLRYAIEDEYLARAEYVAIMRRFGEARPF